MGPSAVGEVQVGDKESGPHLSRRPILNLAGRSHDMFSWLPPPRL